MCIFAADDIDQPRSCRLDSSLESECEVVRSVNLSGSTTTGLGNFRVRDSAEPACRRRPAKLYGLCILLIAENAIIDDDDHDCDMAADDGLDLCPAVRE